MHLVLRLAGNTTSDIHGNPDSRFSKPPFPYRDAQVQVMDASAPDLAQHVTLVNTAAPSAVHAPCGRNRLPL